MPFRILIADDQPVVRRVLRGCAEGHAELAVCADEAENGRQAIDLAIEHTPDAVILDCEMPEVNGLEALPVIRLQLPHRLIIMYSSLEGEETANDALAAGADAYFRKGTHSPVEVVAFVAERLCSPQSADGGDGEEP